MAERLVQREDEELTQIPMNPEAATLVSFVRKLHGWWTASEISAHFHAQNGVRLTDRRIRALAAASEGKIISAPGSKGYKHVRHCTQAEKLEAIKRLRSQAKRMEEKARQIEAR